MECYPVTGYFFLFAIIVFCHLYHESVLKWKISYIDIGVILLGGYTILRSLWCETASWGHYFSLLCLVAFYLVGRFKYGKEKQYTTLLSGIILGGVLQSLIVGLQFFNLLPSFHSYFSYTGSYLNPAPLGGWLSLGMIANIWLLLYKRPASKQTRVLWFIFLFLQTGIWLVANSRAAWIAFCIVAVMMLLQKRQIVVRKRILILASFLLLLSLPTYFYKRQSADARFFIWKICIEMIQDAPFFGHGPQGVSHNYMHYQKTYLDDKGNNNERFQATDNSLTFNEGIRLCCEYGICGLFLMGGLLVVVYYKVPLRHPCIFLLTVFLLFSCFSYPSELFSLSSLFMLILGSLPQRIVSNPKVVIIKCRHIFALLLLLLGTFILYILMCIRINYAIGHYYWDKEEETFLKNCYPYFSCEHNFISRYARSLHLAGEYEMTVLPLTKLTQLAPTVEIYCDLGYAYQQLGNVHQAENCYKYAASMIPNRMTPHYLLFKLYHSLGDKEKTFQEGEYILQMKIKIPNKEIQVMKEDVLRILMSDYLQQRTNLLPFP